MSDTITTETTEPISVDLVETNFFTRYPCTVCGGCTEKVAILAQSDPETDIRVCETCLQRGKIDDTLEVHAQSLQVRATYLRGLKGRLKVPTFAEWCKAAGEDEQSWRSME